MNPIPYEEVMSDHASPVPSRAVALAGTFLFVAAITPPLKAVATVDMFSGGTEAGFSLRALEDVSTYGEADKLVARIQDISLNQDQRDEDEPPPPQRVIAEAIRLIRGASAKMASAMAPAQVSTFFGELNVTWKASGKIVRLACFPDRASVMQTGSLSMPLGSYRSKPNPTPAELAEQLDALAHENDLEERPFLG